MKSIYIFRHGETDFNKEGRFQGHLDVPLNETGRAQIRALGDRLRASGIEAIVSSDLARARESAEIVAAALGHDPIAIHIDPGLREANLGEAQGLTVSEIRAKVGSPLVDRWRSSIPTDADVAYPGGESGLAVGDRVFLALESALALRPDARIWAASTHGGVIRRVMHRLLPPEAPPVRIPNGVAYRLDFDEATKRWQVPRAEPVF